jgi:thiamine-phosphate pyrophosphorylase
VNATNPLPARLLLVTDRHQAAAPLEEVVAEALGAGVRWVWLRDRDLPAAERRALAQRLLALARRHGARLSIGGDVELAADVLADGMHVAAGAPVAPARARLGPHALIGASAHAEADIAAAAAAGADYVTLSPIFASASKPGYGPALGLAALTSAARHALPVLALGGVTAERADACRRAGAAGIAVMGEVMRGAARAGGVRAAVEGYLAALQAAAE